MRYEIQYANLIILGVFGAQCTLRYLNLTNIFSSEILLAVRYGIQYAILIILGMLDA